MSPSDAVELLATRSGGDARTALGALERAVETARASGQAIDVATAEDALQRKAIGYDREGDRHYDYISAWIKATRGSDADASLYYLAVMLEGGEDPRFIARRMVILASEDVGNADPRALVVATAAARRGRPGRAAGVRAQPRAGSGLPCAGAEVERLDRPRSRAACAHVREHGAKLPPDYLRDSHYPGAKKLGRGEGLRLSALRARRRLRPAAACRPSWATSASTSRPTAASRRSCASVSRRSGACASNRWPRAT